MVAMRMRKSAFIKDSLRQVRATIHRFLAILVITTLGVAFFAGLRASGPDMRMTATDYFNRLNFMDIRLVSTVGFNEDDLNAVKNVEGVRSAMPAYFFDALAQLRDKNLTIRLHSLSETAYGGDAINRPELIEGRMPERSGECLADPQFIELSGYSIGDIVRVVSGSADPVSDALKTNTFQIVGIAQNPLYISYERGSSSVGSGKTDAYFLILPTDFEYTVYTEIYLTIRNTASISRFDDTYGDLMEPVKVALEGTGLLRAGPRYEEIKGKARQELDDAKKEVADGYRELADAQKELDDARSELDKGWQDYSDGLKKYNKEIADAKKKLHDAQAKLDKGWRAYYGGVAEFKQEIADAQKKLDNGYAQYENGLKEYEAGLSQNQSGLDAAKAELDAVKRQLDEGSAELERSRREGQQELAEAKNKLLHSEKKLADGRATYEKEKAKGKKELDDALQELNDGEAEFTDSQNEFYDEQADALKELADAQGEIDDGEKELAELKLPEWFVLDHETNIGFLSYKQDAERIEALSLVVPVLFFLVAVLVTMTSMTRLVDSDRPYIGTMKALGYGKGKIALRYLLYAITASVIGGAVGLAAGFNILPRVVFNAYATLYTLPPIQVQFIPDLAVISTGLAVICAALPAWFVCLRSMREAPSELMRPPAPRAGKRTLLERVPFIWRKFNFSQKVAIRNLFRYKKRMFMTIIGVAGCTALMFTGFGLRDSITTIISKQYDTIQNYDIRIDLQHDRSAADMASLDASLENNADILSKTKLTQESVDVLRGSQIRSAFLTVPEAPSEFPSFLRFQDRQTQEPLILADDSILITEKLANMLGLAVGDNVTIRNADGKEATVIIGGVMENYVYHYIFMSPLLYRSAFDTEPSVNQVLCQLRDSSGNHSDALSGSLLEHDAVTSLTFTANLVSNMENMVGALRYVVLVLILSAAALVFVVLFSLTSISLEERSRELATIKVLGFFNRELATYIYRENVVLTIIGTAAGLILGVMLQRYVITTMEINMIMFSRDLLWQSYVYSAGLTLFFATLVNLIMLRYIAKIDMVSSLKSIE